MDQRARCPRGIKHLRFEEFEYDTAVFLVGTPETVFLPPLTFVTTEVVYVKRAIRFALLVQVTLQTDQTFARGVNGKASQVAHYPAPAEPFGDSTCCPASAEKVGDEVAFV
ncbi:hypothetical protein BMS3Bbin04_00304 [bacterium BMS3Bbin04]|nr:hypothetical protein BMS3Bbin04_00304 [bacterium BMS3Bbin04]